MDSRGKPTIETDIILSDGSRGRAAVPSGASRGQKEAIELRDKDPTRYFGMGVRKAINSVKTEISHNIIGMEAKEQGKIDKKMIDLDGSKNLGRLGANAILSVSVATALAQAKSEKFKPFEYFKKISQNKDDYFTPTPLCNVINGGEHTNNNLEFQEFMIVPVKGASFAEKIEIASEVYFTLHEIINEKGYSTAVGDEGGFAPALKDNIEALELLKRTVLESKLKLGSDIALALDVAANSIYDEKTNKYLFPSEEIKRNAGDLIRYYSKIGREFSIISIEDPIREDDKKGWEEITKFFGEKMQIIGDDLFVTNPERLSAGIKEGLANAILIKPNQIGTITKTIETIDIAKNSGYSYIVSHRSGETEDTWIADFAVGAGARQVKFGGLARSERIAKYNRLLRIEEEIT